MAGGALGAGMRFLLGSGLDRITAPSAWPWGTFSANVSGGFAMGLLVAWLMASPRGMDQDLRLLLGVGLLGGFTTFSAFSLEMAMMLERGAAVSAMAYAAASVIIALLALFGGLAAGRAMFA